MSFNPYEIHEDQLSLFEQPTYKITKPIRLIELFAGIGAQAKALENLGVDFETYKVVEFDEHAIKSYNAVHGTSFGTSDVTKIHGEDLQIVDPDKYTYILTYSFPCQDLSLAGKQAGMGKGKGTRSGLLWQVERILNELDELPDVLLMENVPQVHSHKNIQDFKKWITFLENKGYSNFYADLNAKDYGVPQNRNRTFMVSIKGQYGYNFPNTTSLKKRLKDLLEPEVDEKYYIDISENSLFITDECLNKIKVREATEKGYAEVTAGDTIDITYPASKSRRGRVGKQIANTIPAQCTQVVCLNSKVNIDGQKKQPPLQHRVYDGNNIATALNSGFKPNYTVGYSIRKLTPLESFRLMGFSDEDYYKAEKVNSNTQLYKQAGNSIVVDVLMAIFKQML